MLFVQKSSGIHFRDFVILYLSMTQVLFDWSIEEFTVFVEEKYFDVFFTADLWTGNFAAFDTCFIFEWHFCRDHAFVADVYLSRTFWPLAYLKRWRFHHSFLDLFSRFSVIFFFFPYLSISVPENSINFLELSHMKIVRTFPIFAWNFSKNFFFFETLTVLFSASDSHVIFHFWTQARRPMILSVLEQLQRLIFPQVPRNVPKLKFSFSKVAVI